MFCSIVISDTALNLAAHRQKYHIVDLLIRYSANPNIYNKAGKTALHRAVVSYNDENANQILTILQVRFDTCRS
jgi:ankyrin repeat protein